MDIDLAGLRALVTAQEMAAAVALLASPVPSFNSGTNLVVDGALTRGVRL